MEGARLFAALVEVAERLGIEVRVEPFGLDMIRGRGGLCRIGGKPVVVVDERAPLVDRIAVVATVLARRSLGEVEMDDSVRAEIERRRPPKKPKVRLLKPLASIKKR